MTTKIAISLPDELVESARQAVAEHRAASVSAYIADAMTKQHRVESLAEVLADLDRELGPPSADARTWARRMLGKE